jgi:hypothetical protein
MNDQLYCCGLGERVKLPQNLKLHSHSLPVRVSLMHRLQTVDPDFSIYTASLPYAVRRALSPQTSHGAKKLRDALLTDDGQFRWSRFQDVLAQVRPWFHSSPGIYQS